MIKPNEKTLIIMYEWEVTHKTDKKELQYLFQFWYDR